MSDFSVTIQMILVIFLIASAIGVSVTRKVFMAVIVLFGFWWVITEAAVGAGIDTVLFFLTLKKVHALKGTREG